MDRSIASKALHNVGVGMGDTSVTGSSRPSFPGAPTDEAPLGELGHYQIQELVGSGSSGLLYRAIDSRVDRVVAIKVLRSELASHEESRKRFQREARALAGLNHEGVVKLFEFDDTAEFPPYLAMEYVWGLSIAQLLKQRKVIPVEESVALAIQIARALSKAHEAGLVHRDIKPSNILLDENSQPKVTDFGLALLDDGNASLTGEGALAGTPAYISPEQILTPHEVDGRADVYSLGVVLYQMLTGQLPFQGVARMMLLAVLHKDPPPLRQYNDEIPRDVETIVLKAMSKDPDKRYETADAMADDLQRWVDGKPIHARPVGRLERFSRWCKRNPGIAKLSATVAALLITLTIGSILASLNLSAARNETEAQRDRAVKLVESLIIEVDDQSWEKGGYYGSEAILEISLRGLREITDREDELGGLEYSVAKAHLLVARATIWTNFDAEQVNFHLKKAQRVLEKLGGEDSDQWPVIELCIELKGTETSYFSLQNKLTLAEKSLLEMLRIAKKTNQRWPDSFEARLALADVQLAIRTSPTALRELDTFVGASDVQRTLMELQQEYPGDEKVLGLLMQMHYSDAVMAENRKDYVRMIDDFGKFLEHYESLDAQGLATADQHQNATDVHFSLGKIFRKNRDRDTALKHLGKFMDLLSEQYPHEYSLSEVNAVERYIAEAKKQFDENQKRLAQ